MSTNRKLLPLSTATSQLYVAGWVGVAIHRSCLPLVSLNADLLVAGCPAQWQSTQPKTVSLQFSVIWPGTKPEAAGGLLVADVWFATSGRTRPTSIGLVHAGCLRNPLGPKLDPALVQSTLVCLCLPCKECLRISWGTSSSVPVTRTQILQT